MRVYSSMVRIAFNRFQDGLDETAISKRLRTLFGVNCWLALSAAKEAHGMFDRFGQKKVVFGGKFNLIQRLRGKIAKEQFREKRLQAICSLGETRHYGGSDTPDMVAASIEIARKAYKKFEKGWFYPKFNYDNLDERWKQTLGPVKTWKDLFLKIKELKCRYRFQLPGCVRNAVSRAYKKQRWKRYVFE